MTDDGFRKEVLDFAERRRQAFEKMAEIGNCTALAFEAQRNAVDDLLGSYGDRLKREYPKTYQDLQGICKTIAEYEERIRKHPHTSEKERGALCRVCLEIAKAFRKWGTSFYNASRSAA